MSSGAQQLATIIASTERRPAPAGGKIGKPAAHLAAVSITPLQSLAAELALEAAIQDPAEAKVTYAFTDSAGLALDIKEGDVVIVAGVRYTVRAAAEFTRSADGSYTRLVIEERKVSA